MPPPGSNSREKLRYSAAKKPQEPLSPFTGLAIDRANRNPGRKRKFRQRLDHSGPQRRIGLAQLQRESDLGSTGALDDTLVGIKVTPCSRFRQPDGKNTYTVCLFGSSCTKAVPPGAQSGCGGGSAFKQRNRETAALPEAAARRQAAGKEYRVHHRVKLDSDR